MHSRNTQSSFISSCVLAYWSRDDIPRFPRGQKFHKGVHRQHHYVSRGREYGIKASTNELFDRIARRLYQFFFFFFYVTLFSSLIQSFAFFVLSNTFHRVFYLYFILSYKRCWWISCCRYTRDLCRGEGGKKKENFPESKREKFSRPGSHCARGSLWKSLTIRILVIGWARDARARWERGGTWKRCMASRSGNLCLHSCRGIAQ